MSQSQSNRLCQHEQGEECGLTFSDADDDQLLTRMSTSTVAVCDSAQQYHDDSTYFVRSTSLMQTEEQTQVSQAFGWPCAHGFRTGLDVSCRGCYYLIIARYLSIEE